MLQEDQWKTVTAIQMINFINDAPYRDERLDPQCEEALLALKTTLRVRTYNR